MTDKELLEFAAKSTGIKALKSPDGVLRDCTVGDPAMNIFSAKPWNPLTDDGDALRLAVKLGLDVWVNKDCAEVFFGRDIGGNLLAREIFIEDSYASTRRAITRAAAEIGKTLKDEK
jgi:hypothetical protein